MSLLRFSQILRNNLISYKPKYLMHIEQPMVALDFEFDDKRQINEIGAVLFVGDEVKDTFHAVLPCSILHRDGIKSLSTLSFLRSRSHLKTEIVNLVNFTGDNPILAHHAGVEKSLLSMAVNNYNLPSIHNDFFCSMSLAKKIIPQLKTKQLGKIIDFLNIVRPQLLHRALNDSYAAFELWLALRRRLYIIHRLSYEHHFEFMVLISTLPITTINNLFENYDGRDLLFAARKEYTFMVLQDKSKIKLPV